MPKQWRRRRPGSGDRNASSGSGNTSSGSKTSNNSSRRSTGFIQDFKQRQKEERQQEIGQQQEIDRFEDTGVGTAKTHQMPGLVLVKT